MRDHACMFSWRTPFWVPMSWIWGCQMLLQELKKGFIWFIYMIPVSYLSQLQVIKWSNCYNYTTSITCKSKPQFVCLPWLVIQLFICAARLVGCAALEALEGPQHQPAESLSGSTFRTALEVFGIGCCIFLICLLNGSFVVVVLFAIWLTLL